MGIRAQPTFNSDPTGQVGPDDVWLEYPRDGKQRRKIDACVHGPNKMCVEFKYFRRITALRNVDRTAQARLLVSDFVGLRCIRGTDERLAVVACATQTEKTKGALPREGPPDSSTQEVTATDPPTSAAPLRIAQRFNDNYDKGSLGAVRDRWDQPSRAVISRAEYIRRHQICAPATGAVAKVEAANQAGIGVWHVRYEIEGVQLVDTWYYDHGRWMFDILQSNPKAAKLYAMPFAKYAAAVGCSIH